MNLDKMDKLVGSIGFGFLFTIALVGLIMVAYGLGLITAALFQVFPIQSTAFVIVAGGISYLVYIGKLDKYL
jgi:hypothetical protein